MTEHWRDDWTDDEGRDNVEEGCMVGDCHCDGFSRAEEVRRLIDEGLIELEGGS